jgi:hypothetical protein
MRPGGDLGVDMHDPAIPPCLHPGQHRAAEQNRALDEEIQLGKVAGPCHLGHRGFGLRAGGVEHQHIDRAEPAGDRGDQPGDLSLIGDIGAEGLSDAAAAADAAGDLPGRPAAMPAVDRDGQAVAGQPLGDHRAQAARAARHQGDTPMRYRHVAMICSSGDPALMA